MGVICTRRCERWQTRKVFYVSDGKAVAQAGGDRFRKLKATTVSAFGRRPLLSPLCFRSGHPLALRINSTSTPQIQGEHLRIQFDRYLHSRVVARFDGNETAIGPLLPVREWQSPTKYGASFLWPHKRTSGLSDAFGAGERLVIVVGKSGPLTKEVTVTIYGMNAIDYGLLEVRPQ